MAIKYRIMKIINGNLWTLATDGLRPLPDFVSVHEAEACIADLLTRDEAVFTLIPVYSQ